MLPRPSERGKAACGVCEAKRGESREPLRGNVIKLSLIGMSGAGKSYWALKLSGAGFRVISIDDRIEAKLAPELAVGGHRGIGGVAAWMGWPNETTYREREEKYLDYEVSSMNEALDEIQLAAEEGIVLDTTGSVAYTGEEICRRMQSLTTVVYLEASPAEERLLIDRYLSDPKPVLWGDQFAQRPGESAQDAIARCYPQLIAYRKNLYARYARRTVSMERLRNEGLDARGFLELIAGQARIA
jgi:shikimate kinase